MLILVLRSKEMTQYTREDALRGAGHSPFQEAGEGIVEDH